MILADKAKDRQGGRALTATLRKVPDERRNGLDGAPLPPTAYVFGPTPWVSLSRQEEAGELWRATCTACETCSAIRP